MNKIMRLLIAIYYICNIVYVTNAQTTMYPMDIQNKIYEYLRGIDAIPELHSNMISKNCIATNFLIWNGLSNKSIDNNKDLDVIGIYVFKPLQTGTSTQVLLKCHNEYTVLRMTSGKYNEPRDDYSTIIDELQDYFQTHKCINIELLPTYNKVVTDVYINNSKLYNNY